MLDSPTVPVTAAMGAWLSEALGDPGPFELVPLHGGNSNETLLLSSPQEPRRVLRRPPPHAIGPGAHPVHREHRVLKALKAGGVPVPAPLALCNDQRISALPFLVMEHIEGQSLTDQMPPGFPAGSDTIRAIGEQAIDALAAVHRFDWRDGGLLDFGKPDGFHDRQVPRWRAQLAAVQVRDLPLFDAVGDWLHANRPARFEPGVMHSDFRTDNCLVAAGPPIRVAAVIDWEMATIGDPLLDLGLFLALWGSERVEPLAMPRMQGVSRLPGAPTRHELATRYADATGTSVEGLEYYMTLALWKLAAIIEGAYAHYVSGRLASEYARDLEHDVPRLLCEAAGHAGLRTP
jgi:aminoglycoside phosphotransferase (APT) family kinase protein